MKNTFSLGLVLALFLYFNLSYGQQETLIKAINCGSLTSANYGGKTYDADDGNGYNFLAGDNLSTPGHGNFTLPPPFTPTRYTKQTSMTYEFNVVNGQYKVKLLLAEPFHGTGLAGTSDNTRFFNIDIDGAVPLISDLNVFVESGGANQIYTIEEEITVDDGKITLIFSKGSGNDPMVNAIEVLEVSNPGNIPPSANAGSDVTITLPDNSTPLNGSANDPDGTISNIVWDQQNGPSTATFSNPNIVNPQVSNLIEGQYTFQLTVTDNDGATATDDVTVTVNPDNGGGGDPPSGDTVWSESTSNDDIYYTAGNVGIGTVDPDAKLAVKGVIHSQEVRVDLNGAVAPDYVFLKGYNLRSLEEVKTYIQVNGHLPNIPSAIEMEKDGIELKTMNLRLLEKIEELTLYILQQDQEIKTLKKSIKNLR